MKYSEINEFVVDGESYSLDNDKMLFLVPEFLEENLKKVDAFYKNNNYFDYDLHSGLKVFEKKEGFHFKYGYKDRYGNIKIPAIYDMAHDFSEGLARVYSNECHKYGYINSDNEMIKTYQFIAADDFNNGLARVKDYNIQKHQYLWGYVDASFNWMNQPVLLNASNYNTSQARVQIEENTGYKLMDKEGNLSTPLNDISSFNNDLVHIIKFNNNGVYENIVIDVNFQKRTYDNTLKVSLETLKVIDKIRIENLTNIALITDNILAYNLLTRSYLLVDSWSFSNNKKLSKNKINSN